MPSPLGGSWRLAHSHGVGTGGGRPGRGHGGLAVRWGAGQPREHCFCWLPACVSIVAVRATPCLSSEGDQLSQFAQDCGFSCDVRPSELKLESPLLPGMVLLLPAADLA